MLINKVDHMFGLQHFHCCQHVWCLGNWKQWKWKPEMENGKQKLDANNLRVKPLIKDHLLKTTSAQRPHSN